MIWLLSFLFLSMPVAEHKFYVSLTDMVYNEESKRMEIASKYFIDDLELALGLEQGPQKGIQMPMDRNLLPIMSDYMNKHLKLIIQEQEKTFELIGYEVEDDVVWLYLESEEIDTLEEIEIHADQLCDIYSDQQNIVHCTKGKKLQSLFLRKADSSGVLRFD